VVTVDLAVVLVELVVANCGEGRPPPGYQGVI
jgi:hypothetical protein